VYDPLELADLLDDEFKIQLKLAHDTPEVDDKCAWEAVALVIRFR
jgi:hypothetical protein